MTKRSLENQPFFHLLSELNATLPMEYAIRAARRMAPDQFLRLEDIQQRMCEVWRSEGYVDELILRDNLIDHCWDLMQFGYLEDRNPTRVYERYQLKYLNRVRRKVIEQFLPEIGEFDLPFSDQYRICDLLNGNDIPKLITEVNRKKYNIQSAPSDRDIPIYHFVLSIRRPIPRHRGSVQQVHLKDKAGTNSTHIGVMLDPFMSLADIDGALHEFLYHYAIFRQEKSLHCELDSVANDLIMRWGLPAPPNPKAEVTQLNEAHTALNGLYCWDRHLFHTERKASGPVGLAKNDVLKLYQDASGEDGISLTAIQSHYQRVKKRIETLCEEELARQEQARQRRVAVKAANFHE